MRRFILSLTALVIPAALIACGSSGGNTGGSGGGTGGTSPTSSSSSSSGGDTTSSTASGTGGSSTSSSTGTGGSAPVDQCKNASDGAIAASNDLAKIGSDCAVSNLDFSTGMLKEPGLTDCIKNLNGTSDAGTLSDGCAGCFSGTVHCALEKCGTECSPLKGGNPQSAACTACRNTNCDPAFYACSGLPQQN